MRIKRLSVKFILWLVSGIVVFILVLLLQILGNRFIGKLEDQKAASRWGAVSTAAQISAFFSTDSEVSVGQIQDMEHKLDQKLEADSIISASPNAEARLWADTYSGTGSLNISTDHGKMTIKAIGIGGDFFLFHPLKLVNGNYFSGNDVNHDYCVIDTDTAWQLYGSNDICGMPISVGNRTLLICGVVERPRGKLAESAGLKNSVIYVSYDFLSGVNETAESTIPLDHYEIVMPNPIKAYGLATIKELLGVDEEAVEFVENSKRFSLLESIQVIRDFGTRSMNGKAIIYPYWENIARGYEDIYSFITLGKLIGIFYLIILLIAFIVHWYRNKSWTIGKICLILVDKFVEFRARRFQKHQLTVDDIYEGLIPREEKE